MIPYKILACAGFGYTGSSVISDYLSEFENIDVRAGDAEFRFLHEFGGISTLEDCLVHNYHKQNSDGAIHLYLKMVDYYSGNFLARKYNNWFEGKFKELSLGFINDITHAKWNAAIETTWMYKPALVRILYYQINARIKRFFSGGGKIGKFYPKGVFYFASPDKAYFDECVKRYLNKLFAIIDPCHDKEYLYFDQIVPPSNVIRYLDYFDDLRVIVVERDPRDIYIQNYCGMQVSWIPLDIDTFIKVYRVQRDKAKKEPANPRVLRVRFEDAIYHYDEFCEQVNNFAGLIESQHLFPKQKFNPSISVKNTKLWEKYEIPKELVNKIEKELSEYIYEY